MLGVVLETEKEKKKKGISFLRSASLIRKKKWEKGEVQMFSKNGAIKQRVTKICAYIDKWYKHRSF